MKYETYIGIDVETTGLEPSRSSVIQVCAIKFSPKGEILDIFNQYYYPKEGYIPEEAAKVNHITMDMVKGCNTYESNPYPVHQFCDGFPLVGHNIDYFDMKFLGFKNVNIPETFDTMNYTRKKYGKRISLENMCTKLGFHADGEYHNAVTDVKQVIKLFLSFMEDAEQIVMDLPKEEVKFVPSVLPPVVPRVAKETPKDRPYILDGKLGIPMGCSTEYQYWLVDTVINTPAGPVKPYKGVKFKTIEEITKEAVVL